LNVDHGKMRQVEDKDEIVPRAGKSTSAATVCWVSTAIVLTNSLFTARFVVTIQLPQIR
jgi:hypothetical protein